ncbi:glycosyltransferase family A protein [Mesorhizobium salmacidum]|uniref:Glycosyltransferase family A protein n=1 Tax=Mesorhizobium salmacidum TaxID=3015171 RepID=A0ABU8L4Z9_9HYPH
MTDHGITIIVPTYNHEAYIADAIESVLDQSVFEGCKVIISDDSSTDNTVEIAQSVSAGFSNIIVRQNTSNLGVMEHYRLLSSLVDTPYLAILEGDDHWAATEKLELQKSLMDAHPNTGLCFTACSVNDEATGATWDHPGWPVDRHRVVHLLDMLASNPVATFSNCLYRTHRFAEAVQCSSTKGGYDWLLNMTIASEGGALFAARNCTGYRLHANGAWTRLDREQKRSGILQSLVALKNNVDSSFFPYIDAAILRAQHEA